MIYKKIFKIISIISNIKIYFFKPSKSNILVYDRHSKLFAKAIFKKKKYIFFDTRWESINIQILILSLFKCKSFNFFEIKRNYKLLFFEIISPKIVYTSIDNNPGFYKLKELYPKAIYISDQNGIRHNAFYNYSKNYYRKERKKLQCDYFFVLGLNYYLKISKYVKAKYIVGGNTLNNEYPKKKI